MSTGATMSNIYMLGFGDLFTEFIAVIHEVLFKLNWPKKSANLLKCFYITVHRFLDIKPNVLNLVHKIDFYQMHGGNIQLCLQAVMQDLKMGHGSVTGEQRNWYVLMSVVVPPRERETMSHWEKNCFQCFRHN